MQAQPANTDRREERRRAIERWLSGLEPHERHRAIVDRIAQIQLMRARLGLTPSRTCDALQRRLAMYQGDFTDADYDTLMGRDTKANTGGTKREIEVNHHSTFIHTHD